VLAAVRLPLRAQGGLTHTHTHRVGKYLRITASTCLTGMVSGTSSLCVALSPELQGSAEEAAAAAAAAAGSKLGGTSKAAGSGEAAAGGEEEVDEDDDEEEDDSDFDPDGSSEEEEDRAAGQLGGRGGGKRGRDTDGGCLCFCHQMPQACGSREHMACCACICHW
jgi:hypothetical protein